MKQGHEAGRVVSPARSAARAAWSVLAVAVLGSGCASSLPSVGFEGMAIKMVQPTLQPGAFKVTSLVLDLELAFLVRNPLPGKLTIPQHDFTLRLGDTFAKTPSLPETSVEPGGKLKLRYPFHLDLAAPELAQLLGRDDVPYAFGADVAIDVPPMLGQALQAAMPEFQNGKLILRHEGTLRLPLPPSIEWANAGPKVEFLGVQAQPGAPNPVAQLQQIRGQLAPFVAMLKTVLNARPGTTFTLSPTEVMALLVGNDAAGGAIRALSFAGINVTSARITLPVQTPTPMDGLKSLNASAPAYWGDFERAWDGFDPGRLAGMVTIPGAMPQGVKVSVPFRIKNPNRFQISVPSFRLGALKQGAADPLASFRAVPQGQAATPLTSPPKEVLIPPGATTDMALVSELRWDQLGGFLGAIQGGTVPPVRITGDVTLDLGMGQLVLPVNVGP